VGDEQLIARARRGDEAAWAALVGQHQQAAFRLAYLIMGSADDAEDVTQDAFIRAFESLDQFDASRPFRPWLLGITRNLAYNRHRSARRYLNAVRRLLQAAPEPVVAPAGERSQPYEAEMLWQAVKRLQEIDQEVIYLRYFLELSVAETADTLQVAPGTVKSRLHRALNRLRDLVDEEFSTLGRDWKDE
jgi:RNA polymerase sigma-70 factor (ECF subfamily)